MYEQTVQTQIRLLFSGSTPFAVPSASFGHIIEIFNQSVSFLGQLQ